MSAPEELYEFIEARRACFVGAKQDVEAAITTLENAETIELARTALLGQLRERAGLLDLAIEQTDEALAGR